LLYGYEPLFKNLQEMLKGEKKYGRDLTRRDEFVARGSGELCEQLPYQVMGQMIEEAGFTKVLDLGCGNGQFLVHLANRLNAQYQGFGIDQSKEAIEEARAEKEAGFAWSGKTVAVLGLAFKRDTNDIRNSPAIDLVNWLVEKQAGKICLYDPVAEESFKKLFPADEKFQYFTNEREALQQADAIIIATDWPQFRGLADVLISSDVKPLIMDGRRMLQHRYDDLQKNGFKIIAVGSPFIT
jgi:SAM-dependent methyltransferase